MLYWYDHANDGSTSPLEPIMLLLGAFLFTVLVAAGGMLYAGVDFATQESHSEISSIEKMITKDLEEKGICPVKED